METPAAATAVKSPAEEPGPGNPTRIQHPKPLSFTNGALKLRRPHAPPPPGAWRECLKNHAAAMGGHAVDGCGEFLPSAGSTAADPTSLRCAACGCHRNFHRRDPESPPEGTHLIDYQPHHRHHPQPPPRSPNSPSPPPISSTYYPSAPHMLLALSTPNANPNPSPSPRKRFRTKFTQNQKDKMQELAERLGWKMQRKDDDTINDFCNGIGVDKGVFKVWMHNNKNTFGKKESATTNNGSNGLGIDLDSAPLPGDFRNRHNLNHHSDEVSAHPVNTNASSSSSRD